MAYSIGKGVSEIKFKLVKEKCFKIGMYAIVILNKNCVKLQIWFYNLEKVRFNP